MRINEVSKCYLQGYKQELKATVKENEALRHSVEKWKEDASVTRYRIVSKLADSFVDMNLEMLSTVQLILRHCYYN